MNPSNAHVAMLYLENDCASTFCHALSEQSAQFTSFGYFDGHDILTLAAKSVATEQLSHVQKSFFRASWQNNFTFSGQTI